MNQTATTATTAPPFAALMRIEPELAGMLAEIQAIRPRGRNFCANDVWYRVYKPRLLRLVGWESGKAELQSMQAYDVAYQTLYDALPACRRCACARLSDFGL
jgi:hypothetical protein